MSEQPDKKDKTMVENTTARKLFWASAGFYALIAFEFFYMASPFAAYFYSVYGPGLDGLQSFGFSGWTIWFFLPHIVENTRSTLINIAEPIGLLLFFGGLIAFAAGAFQVYRSKLKKADAVMGGLYRYIRHPQYLALMLASVGLLLIWPRFLVLFSTCFVFLAYIWLAKTEEKICLAKYAGYAEYMTETGRFLPKGWKLFSWPSFESKFVNFCFGLTVFVSTLTLFTAIAFGIRTHAIDSLYTLETDQGVYLSVVELNDTQLQEISQIALEVDAVKTQIAKLSSNSNKFLAYVLPTQMYVSEIPMHLPEGGTFGHTIPANRDFSRYKVIFTRAVFPVGQSATDSNIIANAVNKYPLIEVQLNLETKKVDAILPPPENSFYPDVQVPLF